MFCQIPIAIENIGIEFFIGISSMTPHTIWDITVFLLSYFYFYIYILCVETIKNLEIKKSLDQSIIQWAKTTKTKKKKCNFYSRLLQRQIVHCPAKMDFFSRFGSLYNVHSMAENLFQKIKQPLTCSHLNVALHNTKSTKSCSVSDILPKGKTTVLEHVYIDYCWISI